MLGKVAWKTNQFGREPDSAPYHDIIGIQSSLPNLVLFNRRTPTAPDHIGQRSSNVFCQSQSLAHITDSAARAVADDSGHDGRSIATIALIDPLHHFFAAFMLEIDIDIRWFLPLRREEPFEQDIRVFWINCCDSKTITDRRIGSGAAALAKNILRAGIFDDVINREEIGCIFKPFDYRQLLPQNRTYLFRNAFRIALCSTFPRFLG